jgi:hypothetical protein
MQDTGFLAYKIVPHENNHLLLFSTLWAADTIGSSGYLTLIQYTTNLDFISRLNISIPTEYINLDVRSVLVVNESIWIFGHALEQFGCPTRDDLFFAVLDSNVNLINIEFYNDSHNPDRVLDVKWDSLNHNFRAITEGLSNTAFSQYVTIDTNLNITKIQDIPLVFEQPHNLFLKGPNDIVLTNAYRNIASLYPDTKVNIGAFRCDRFVQPACSQHPASPMVLMQVDIGLTICLVRSPSFLRSREAGWAHRTFFDRPWKWRATAAS